MASEPGSDISSNPHRRILKVQSDDPLVPNLLSSPMATVASAHPSYTNLTATPACRSPGSGCFGKSQEASQPLRNTFPLPLFPLQRFQKLTSIIYFRSSHSSFTCGVSPHLLQVISAGMNRFGVHPLSHFQFVSVKTTLGISEWCQPLTDLPLIVL